MDALLDDLTSNLGVTLYKFCFLLERCGMVWVSDGLQAEYQWEMGQLQIEKYVQMEAEQLVGRLADANNLDQQNDSLVSIASNLAAHVQVTKETWQRQAKRQGTKQDDEVRKMEEDIYRIGEEVGDVLARKDSVLYNQSNGSIRDELVQSRQGNIGEEGEGVSGDGKGQGDEGKYDQGDASKSRVGELQEEDKLGLSQDSTRDSGIGRCSEGPGRSANKSGSRMTELEEDGNNEKHMDDTRSQGSAASIGSGKRNGVDTATQKADRDNRQKPLLTRNASVRQLAVQIREMSETLDQMMEDQRQLKEERDTCYALLGYNPVDGQLNNILETTLAEISKEIGFAKANDESNEQRIEELHEQVRMLRREMSKPKNVMEEPPPSRNETPQENRDLKQELELLQAQAEYWQRRCDVLEKTRRLGYYYVSLVNGVRFHQPNALQNDRKLSNSMVTYDPEDMELQNGQLLFREGTNYSGTQSRRQSQHSAGPTRRRPSSGLRSRPHTTGHIPSGSSSRKGSTASEHRSSNCSSRSNTPRKELITPTLRKDGAGSRGSQTSRTPSRSAEQNGVVSPTGESNTSRQSTPDDTNTANRRWTVPAVGDKHALATQKKLAKDLTKSREQINGLPPVEDQSESNKGNRDAHDRDKPGRDRQSPAGRRSQLGSQQKPARSCASPACPIGDQKSRKSISSRRASETKQGDGSRRPSCVVHQDDIDAGRRPSCTHPLDPELVKERLEKAAEKQRLPPRRDSNVHKPTYCTCCTKCCPRGEEV